MGNDEFNEIIDGEVEPWDLEDMYYKQWRDKQAISDRLKTQAKKAKV